MLVTSLLISLTIAFGSSVQEAPGQGSEAEAGAVLWQNVRVGMDESTLRSRRPAIVPYKNNLVERGVLVADQTFDAYFILEHGKVAEVHLENGSTTAGPMVDALNLKYGEPRTAFACQRVATAKMCTATWAAPGGVAIKLKNITGAGLTTLLSVDFRKIDASGL